MARKWLPSVQIHPEWEQQAAAEAEWQTLAIANKSKPAILFWADAQESFKTCANHVTAYLERRLDFMDYNYLRNREPLASQEQFRFEDLFITALKLRLTSPANVS